MPGFLVLPTQLVMFVELGMDSVHNDTLGIDSIIYLTIRCRDPIIVFITQPVCLGCLGIQQSIPHRDNH